MKKAVLPTCIILLIASLLCFLVAREYLEKKREETLAKLNKTNQSNSEEVLDESEVVSAERLTITDTVFLVGKDIENKELIFRNIEGGDDKALSFNGTTQFLSKRDQVRTADELRVGEILDITFTTFDSMLSTVRESQSTWTNKSIRRFTIDEEQHTLRVADSLYEIVDNVVVASSDKIGKLMDITNLDAITIVGIDEKIYSIIVDDGHGYIRITNDSYFVGGWIEIGQEMIKVLTEDMLIPVPEGTYDIKVTNKGYIGREKVEVYRDKETLLDLSKAEIEEAAIGHVKFDIKPDYAQLYVDGLMTDFEERVPLEYGIHSLRVESAGYETIQSNIKVGSEFANISIVLDESLEDDSTKEEEKEETKNETSGTADKQTSNTENTTLTSNNETNNDNSSSKNVLSDNKKIYVDGPEGAEVYIDGTYIGVAPCSTNKVTGSHTITLSRNGYLTKTYSISVDNDGNDLTMSFSELAKE